MLKPASAAERRPILLAEDSPDDAFFMQLALEKAALSHPLFIVSDGQEVIDYLEGAQPFTERNLYPLPALILLDIQMPRRNAFDVLSWLQNRPDLKGIPVVIFTGSDNQSDRDKASAMGARAFHRKSASPQQHDKLIQTLHKLLPDQPSTRPALLAAKLADPGASDTDCLLDESRLLQGRLIPF